MRVIIKKTNEVKKKSITFSDFLGEGINLKVSTESITAPFIPNLDMVKQLTTTPHVTIIIDNKEELELLGQVNPNYKNYETYTDFINNSKENQDEN